MRTSRSVRSTHPDDRDDWSAAVSSDPRAFARLFDRHRDDVFRQALRIVAQPDDAEDVAAATFLELWRKRDSVHIINGSIRPWLLTTAANLGRNSRRARLRHETFLTRLSREPHHDWDQQAFEKIDDDLPRRDLVRALRQLRQKDVVLITLTLLEGYRLSEVAQLLELSEGAARVRLHRARARLRALLLAPDNYRLERQEAT